MAGRWITVRKPFDYRFASGAIVAFADAHLGEHMVKGEVADFAIEKGFATDGKLDGSEAKSDKGKVTKAKSARAKATRATKSSKAIADASTAADSGRNNRLAGKGLAGNGGADAGAAVDKPAG